MSDHNQRIHPVHDVEAPHTPSAPLFPRNTSKSDRPEPEPEPVRGPVAAGPAVVHPKKRRSRSCCCKFLCWIISLLLILIVAIGITIGILFLVFRPKLPKYSVDGLRIAQFKPSGNNSLSVTFNVTVTARNPNKRIGIYYEGGSHVRAYYNDTKLCEGSLPKFYQGHRNTTVLYLPLTGQTQDASGLQTVLTEQLQRTGNIPLNLRAKQPVRVKLGKLKLFKVKFKVRCRLVVDSLDAGNEVKISSSSCKFRFRL